MTTRDIRELAAAARNAESTLRGVPFRATQVAASTRRAMREVAGRWDLSADQKREGQRLAREEGERDLTTLRWSIDQAELEVRQYVEAARSQPLAGDTAAELRRDRAYRRLEAATANEPNDLHRVGRVRELYRHALTRGERSTLEAAREMLRDLGDRSPETANIVADDLDHLDAVAGPAEAIEAMVIAKRLEPGIANTRLAVNMAQHPFLYDDPDKPSGLLAPDYDGNVSPVLPSSEGGHNPLVSTPKS